jgi:hypothetical protein
MAKTALTKDEILFDDNKNGVLEPSEQQMMKSVGSYLNVDEVAESKNPKSGTDVTSTKTKLTVQAARALMETAAENANYMGKFSTADIAQFMKEFDAQQALQVAKVVTSTARKVTPGGTTQGAVDKTMETTAKTEFPSFFKPTEFAADWVWNKINFKNEKGLGAKSLDALAQVRGVVKSFQLLGVTDNDIRVAAKQIARGKKTIDDYTVELQQIAKKEYPQFADRFNTDPTLTTYDIASPIIKLLAKTWEVDEKDVSFDDPIVSSYMNYAGADGKGQQPSRYQSLLKAKSHRKYQETQEANENARDAAVGLARAFGFGV